MDSRKLLIRGYKLKKPNTTDLEKRPATTEAEEINDRLTEADVNTLHRSIEPAFFFFFLQSSNNLRFGFLALKVPSQALLETFRSARKKSITFFAARLVESLLADR